MDATYGIDWDGLLPHEEWDGPLSERIVQVPQVRCPLTDTHYESLARAVNSLGDSTSHGIDLYLQTLSFVQGLIDNEE